MEDKPRFSKLAVTSFILTLSSIMIMGLGLIIDFIIRPEFPAFSGLGMIIAPPINLVALTFSIISLRVIKRNNLRGKMLAWISLVISILLLLLTLSYGFGWIFRLFF